MNKYNNKYHKIILKKPVDLNPTMHVDFNKENYKEGPKFRVGDNIRTSKYKNIFVKVMLQIGLMKFLWLQKLKILFPGHMLLVIFMENCGKFTKKNKNYKKQTKKSLRKSNKEKGR